MINLSQGLFMAEAEGLLDTRESALRAIVQDIKNYPEDSMPDLVFYSICESHGISAGSLTFEEFERIKREIER